MDVVAALFFDCAWAENLPMPSSVRATPAKTKSTPMETRRYKNADCELVSFFFIISVCWFVRMRQGILANLKAIKTVYWLSPLFFLQLRNVFCVATESFLRSRILSDVLGEKAHSSFCEKDAGRQRETQRLRWSRSKGSLTSYTSRLEGAALCCRGFGICGVLIAAKEFGLSGHRAVVSKFSFQDQCSCVASNVAEREFDPPREHHRPIMALSPLCLRGLGGPPEFQSWIKK